MDFKELGFSLNHILRYGYSGLLVALMSSIIYPAFTKRTFESLGDVLSPLVLIALGASFYSFYKPVINEMIFANLFEFFHRFEQTSKDNQDKNICTCRTFYLEKKFAVPRKYIWNAYRIVRHHLLNKEFPEMSKRVEQQHSEIHLLFLSSSILGLSLIFLFVSQLLHGWHRIDLTLLIFVGFILSTWFGIRADINLCRYEASFLYLLKNQDIEELLKKVGLCQLPLSSEIMQRSPAPEDTAKAQSSQQPK